MFCFALESPFSPPGFFFVSFRIPRALGLVLSPPPALPQLARDTGAVGLPASSSLRANGSHQLPLSSPEAGKRASTPGRKGRSNCGGRTQALRTCRRAPRWLLPLSGAVSRQSPQSVRLASLPSCPTSKLASVSARGIASGLEPPPVHHESTTLYPRTLAGQTRPHQEHQDPRSHRRLGQRPGLHLPGKCPLVLPVPSLRSCSPSPWRVYARGQQTHSVKGRMGNVSASAGPAVPCDYARRKHWWESCHRRHGNEHAWPCPNNTPHFLSVGLVPTHFLSSLAARKQMAVRRPVASGHTLVTSSPDLSSAPS